MRYVLFLLLLIGLTNQVAAQARTTHVVKAGETLFAISRQYSVPVDDIKRWNNITGSTISTGQRLFVGPPTGQPATTTQIQHRVSPGETLTGISRRYGVTIAELTEWNTLASTMVETGQILVIRRSVQNVIASPISLPAVDSVGSASRPQGHFASYVWKRNDVLSAVLMRSNMTQEEFVALNPDVDITNLRVGADVVLLLPPSITYTNPFRASRPDPSNLGSFSAGVYSDGEIGKRLTSGDLYSHERLTAGHNTLPLGTVVYVEHPQRGDGIFVIVNDRILEAEIRLSKTAFDALGLRAGQAQTVLLFSEQP